MFDRLGIEPGLSSDEAARVDARRHIERPRKSTTTSPFAPTRVRSCRPMLEIFDRLESEARSYIRAFPSLFERGSGSCLFDAEGRRYIDFFAGAGALNYGHNDPAINQAIIAYLQADGVVHGLDMATTARQRFHVEFERIVLRPRGLDYKVQFPGPTGANAVEAALKLARLVTGRRNIIAFTSAYHGVSLGALSPARRRSRHATTRPIRLGSQHPVCWCSPADLRAAGYHGRDSPEARGAPLAARHARARRRAHSPRARSTSSPGRGDCSRRVSCPETPRRPGG